MEDLRLVSGHLLDDMWLFSVELFEKEVKKFDLKGVGEFKETEEEMKVQSIMQKAKDKNR